MHLSVCAFSLESKPSQLLCTLGFGRMSQLDALLMLMSYCAFRTGILNSVWKQKPSWIAEIPFFWEHFLGRVQVQGATLQEILKANIWEIFWRDLGIPAGDTVAWFKDVLQRISHKHLHTSILCFSVTKAPLMHQVYKSECVIHGGSVQQVVQPLCAAGWGEPSMCDHRKETLRLCPELMLSGPSWGAVLRGPPINNKTSSRPLSNCTHKPGQTECYP